MVTKRKKSQSVNKYMSETSQKRGGEMWLGAMHLLWIQQVVK